MKFLMKLFAIKLLIFASIAPIGAMDVVLSTPEKIALKRRLIRERKERESAARLQPKVETIAPQPAAVAQVTPPVKVEEKTSQEQTKNADQYRVSVKKLANTQDEFQINITKKSKNLDATETTKKCSLVANFSKHATIKEENLFAPFSTAQVVNNADQPDPNYFLWDIPDFGLLKIGRDGSVSFGHGANEAPLADYDLILETSGKLFLQTLKVAALTIESQEAQLCEAVVADRLHIDHSVQNTGALKVQHLTGAGELLNQGKIELEGSEQKPATIGVKKFTNKKNKLFQTMVQGSYVRITGENESFHNGNSAHVTITEKLTIDFSRADLCFTNKGRLLTWKVDLSRKASNSGLWRSHTMTSRNRKFTNEKFGQVKILESFSSSCLFNDGELAVKKSLELWMGWNTGKITGLDSKLCLSISENMINKGQINLCSLMGKGTFENNGYLELNGLCAIQNLINQSLPEEDLRASMIGIGEDFGLKDICFINHADSDVILKKGSTSQNVKITNAGNWAMEDWKSSHPFKMKNRQTGTLQLMDNTLTFGQLSNEGNIIIRSGVYTINALKKCNRLQLLQNNWTITDDPLNAAPHRIVFASDHKSKWREGRLGEIECEKNICFDADIMLSPLRAQGDITYSNRIPLNINGLRSIQTPGKVTVWCSPISAKTPEPNASLLQGLGAIFGPKALDFPNIGHLELFVKGPFTTHYSLSAPILTLHVDGPLTLGKDNEHLGTITATDGPLTVDAHSIDARYGKLYGKGKSLLESTKSDITIGAEARGVDESVKQQFMKSYPRPGGGGGFFVSIIDNFLASFDYTLDVMNGAYAASGDRLVLKSAANIFIKFGEVNGTLGNCLIAPKEIQNLSGRISSKGPIAIRATEYNHLRKGAVNRYTSSEHYVGYPGSGPAVLESLEEIDFQVKSIRNVAGSMRSGKNICINKMALAKETGYIEEPQDFLLTYFNGHGWGGDWGWKSQVVNTQFCTTQSGGDIQINLGHSVLTGSASAPGKISVRANTALFANASRSRRTLNATQPLIADVTDFLEGQAQKPGMLRKGATNCFETEFPLGAPSRPQDGDVVLLENPQGHTPLWKEIFNPLGSINLDLHLQHLLGNLAGRVHAGKAKGNNLSTMLWANANRWRQLHNKDVMSQADLQNITQSMLLTQIVFNGATAQQQTLLCIAPQDVNPYQDQGDTVGGEIEITGEQTHQNNRLVANGPEGITLTSPGDINLETQKYTVSHETKEQRVVQELAYPQQQLLAPAGPINVTAHKNITRTGTLMAAGTNSNEQAQTGSVVKNPLVLQTFVENRREESDGWFSSTETVETSLTHQAVPSTTMAGIKLHDKAADTIQSVASQDFAGQEIVYEAPHTNIEGLLVANRTTKHTQKDGMFTQQETSESKETPYGIPATIQAPLVRFVGEDARVNAHTQAHELRDETEKGVEFVAKVAQMLCSGQTLVDSPMMSVNAGYKAGYEVMIPPMLMVEKIVRAKEAGHMVFESAVMDRDRTEIIGKFVETTYHLKQWQTSWCHKSQVIPDEALVVVAFAIAVATQGMGVEFLAPMLESVTAATGMQLSAAGIAAVNAGFTTVCCSAGTSFLRTGDPIQTVEQLGSPAQLKSLAFNMASAGLCAQLGKMLKVDMKPGLKSLTGHVQEQALRGTVDTLLNVAINHAPVDRAMCDALKQAPIKAVVAYAANQICTAYMDTISQKAMQTVVGGVSGFAMNNNRDGFIAGATGALTAEVVGDALIADAHAISDAAITKLKAAGKPLTQANIQQAIQLEVQAKTDLAKIAAGGVAALTRQNPAIAIAAATNAMDNDLNIRGTIYVMEEFKALLNAASQAIANLEAHMEPAQEAPVKLLKPKRKPQAVENDAQDEAARDLTLQLIQRSQETYDDLILECAQESLEAKPKREKPRIATVAKEIIRDAAIDAVNKTVDLVAMVPNPVGMACFAGSVGRDLYTGRKTAGEIGFDMALGYGALKGIQWTGKGIKFLYQSGKNIIMNAPETIQLVGRNLKLLYQDGKNITIKMNDKMLDTLHQMRYKASGRVPFVENPRAGIWHDAAIACDDLALTDSALYEVAFAGWRKDPRAPFNVVGHGNPSAIYVDLQGVHPKGLSQANLQTLREQGSVGLNGIQAARLIRTAPGYKKGQHINILSCELGADPKGLPKQIANRMNVPVSAFTELVYLSGVKNDLRAIVRTQSKETGKYGVMKTFYPDSGIKKSLIAAATIPLALLSADERSKQDDTQYDQYAAITNVPRYEIPYTQSPRVEILDE